jgi:hypothetical protein
MLSVSIMAVPSAAGHGTKDGTREAERDISMDEMRPRRKWSDSELNQVKFLHASNSTSQIAKLFKTTKNAVIGALYRDKIRNGYVPPEDSKYTGPKNL